jgi:hypothetical protein
LKGDGEPYHGFNRCQRRLIQFECLTFSDLQKGLLNVPAALAPNCLAFCSASSKICIIMFRFFLAAANAHSIAQSLIPKISDRFQIIFRCILAAGG